MATQGIQDSVQAFLAGRIFMNSHCTQSLPSYYCLLSVSLTTHSVTIPARLPTQQIPPTGTSSNWNMHADFPTSTQLVKLGSSQVLSIKWCSGRIVLLGWTQISTTFLWCYDAADQLHRYETGGISLVLLADVRFNLRSFYLIKTPPKKWGCRELGLSNRTLIYLLVWWVHTFLRCRDAV
jgi:hypothetical protein